METGARGRWRAPDAVLAAAGLLALAASLAVAASGPGRGEALDDSEARAALRGAVGLGRAVDLSRCPGAFDPRSGGDCALRWWPVPGGTPLCPDHALPSAGAGR